MVVLEAEVAAALISLGGSFIMGLGAAAYKKGYLPGGCGGSRRSNDDRALKKLLKHRVFMVGGNTSKPIVVKFDPVRTKLFQHIQYNIFCKNVQATLRDWLMELLSGNHRSPNWPDESSTEHNENSLFEVLGVGGASKTNVPSELLKKMVESDAHREQFMALPTQVQSLVKRMLDDFYGELTNVFLCTIIDPSSNGGIMSGSRLQFRKPSQSTANTHTVDQSLISQLLDLTHVLMVVTMSKWVTMCDHLNGTLNGVRWNGEKISYVCHSSLRQWCSEVGQLWAVLESINLVGADCSYVLTDRCGKVVEIGGNFEEKTGFKEAEIINEGIKLLQMGLDFESSQQNKVCNERTRAKMKNHNSFTATFNQFNKISTETYQQSVYASPFNHVSSESTDGMYWVLQHRSGTLSQKNHTLTAFIVQTTLEGDYLLTCCSYKPSKSMIVDAVHYCGQNTKILGGVVCTGMCLTQQLNLNMSTMDTLVRSVNELCGEEEFNEGMTNTRSFVHKYEDIQYKAVMWVMGAHILIVHQPEKFSFNKNVSQPFIKKYTKNY